MSIGSCMYNILASQITRYIVINIVVQGQLCLNSKRCNGMFVYDNNSWRFSVWFISLLLEVFEPVNFVGISEWWEKWMNI